MPFNALAHVLEGEVEITISSKPVHLKAGDFVLMCPGQPHEVKAITRFKMLLTINDTFRCVN